MKKITLILIFFALMMPRGACAQDVVDMKTSKDTKGRPRPDMGIVPEVSYTVNVINISNETLLPNAHVSILDKDGSVLFSAIMSVASQPTTIELHERANEQKSKIIIETEEEVFEGDFN